MQRTPLENAKAAASAAVDYEAYQAWATAGEDPNEALALEAVAVAYLEPPCLTLLAAIAAASAHPDGAQRYAERTEYALKQGSDELAKLVTQHEQALAELENQREGGAPPSGAAFGPVPAPPNDDDDGYRP